MLIRLKRSNLDNEIGEVVCVQHEFPKGKPWERHSIEVATMESKPYEICKDKKLKDGEKYFTRTTIPEESISGCCDSSVTH